MAETQQIHIRIPRYKWLDLQNELQEKEMNQVMNDLIDTYLLQKKAKEDDVDKVQREVQALEIELQAKQEQVIGKKLLLKRLHEEKKFEEQRRLEEFEAKRKAELCCFVCEQPLKGPRELVKAGEHKGLFICGNFNKGCAAGVLNGDNRWWILGDKVKV